MMYTGTSLNPSFRATAQRRCPARIVQGGESQFVPVRISARWIPFRAMSSLMSGEMSISSAVRPSMNERPWQRS